MDDSGNNRSALINVTNNTLLVGAGVALLIFFLGQVVIPVSKYCYERVRSKRLILTIMEATTDKTLYFLRGLVPDHEPDIVAEEITKSFNQLIDEVRKNPDYVAHLTVSIDGPSYAKILDNDQFWLMDDEVVKSFVRFEENALVARHMCELVMSEAYLELVKNDRERYVAGLEQIKSQFQEWYQSARDLKEILLH